MNITYRIGITVLPGSIVTAALLLFMVALIVSEDYPIIITPDTTIKPFFHIDQRVIPIINEKKAVKPTDPQPTPEKKAVNETITNPDKTFSPIYKIDPQITILTNTIIDTDYIPVYVTQPRFPTRAVTKGVSGYAVVTVTITTTGAVRNVVMIEEYPTGYGFGHAALKAASKLKYNPRVVNGIPREVPDVPYRFSFNIK